MTIKPKQRRWSAVQFSQLRIGDYWRELNADGRRVGPVLEVIDNPYRDSDHRVNVHSRVKDGYGQGVDTKKPGTVAVARFA